MVFIYYNHQTKEGRYNLNNGISQKEPLDSPVLFIRFLHKHNQRTANHRRKRVVGRLNQRKNNFRDILIPADMYAYALKYRPSDNRKNHNTFSHTKECIVVV